MAAKLNDSLHNDGARGRDRDGVWVGNVRTGERNAKGVVGPRTSESTGNYEAIKWGRDLRGEVAEHSA